MRNRHLYPANWKELAQACKERAGFQCQICGIAQGAERISRRGNQYTVYLQAAHKDHNVRAYECAELLCLCAICHWWFDFEHAQQAFERRVARYQWDQAKKIVAEKCRNVAAGHRPANKKQASANICKDLPTSSKNVGPVLSVSL